jgi:release factor glutamine methyltransferase
MNRPEGPWTVLEVLEWTAGAFKTAGIDSPRLTAEVLLAVGLDCGRLDLYLNYDRPLSEDERAVYRELVRRRLDREPTAYIVGQRAFWTIELAVGPGVLIPRPETEGLVEAALAHLAVAGRDAPRLLDMCTGSGAVALALAAEGPGARVTAVDLSPQALAWAKKNAVSLGLADRVDLVAADLFSAVGPGTRFEVITINPPYVSGDEWDGLAPEIRDHEPRQALVAGPTGLEVVGRVAAEAARHLTPGGLAVCEIGHGQADEAAALFEAFFGRVEVGRDLSGTPRLIKAAGPRESADG